LDEMNFGNNTRTYIMDIADLDNPQIIGFFEAPVESIDHNMYSIGDKMYQSNYLSGLRILDIADAESGSLELVGYFDTNPESDAPSFNGTWSNFPFFPSGNVAVSTFTHFFMVRPSDDIAPNTSALSEQEPSKVSRVFPNPASSSIQIEGFEGCSTLEIYSNTGQLIKTWSNLPTTKGLNLLISDLKGGVYVLKGVETNQSVRFIVH